MHYRYPAFCNQFPDSKRMGVQEIKKRRISKSTRNKGFALRIKFLTDLLILLFYLLQMTFSIFYHIDFFLHIEKAKHSRYNIKRNKYKQISGTHFKYHKEQINPSQCHRNEKCSFIPIIKKHCKETNQNL